MLTHGQRIQLIIDGVDSGRYPARLYKYRQFNEHTESVFRDNYLWFSKPRDFNDPFDCKIADAGNYTAQDVVDYLTGCGVSPVEASAMVLKNASNEGFFRSILESAKEDVFNSKGILALSERPDSILMWAYYALGHSGFVLGFDLRHDPSFFVTPLHVSYQEAYPAFRYLKDKRKILTDGVLTKSHIWAHEREIRVLKNCPGPHHFNKRCLVEVILGCKATNANRDDLVRYLRTYGYAHVRLKRAVPSPKSYELVFEDLTLA